MKEERRLDRQRKRFLQMHETTLRAIIKNPTVNPATVTNAKAELSRRVNPSRTELPS